MSRAILPLLILLLAVGTAGAVPTDIVYAEGQTSVRFRTGAEQEASIGEVLNTGDMLKTGRDGMAELDQKGVMLKVNPNTVFTLMEREQGGSSTPVLSLVLGSIKFRYDKLTGKEPVIRTNSAAAGVRGTEFSVFAGADGSSLIVVDSGIVTVEAEGKSVELAADEGVEVPLGRPPSEKFTVQRDQVDYSTWNDGKLDAMLADPNSALGDIARAMSSYAKDVKEYSALYDEYAARLKAERENRVKINDQKGKEEAQKYETEVVFPLTVKASNLSLNVRYSALAALSLRRFVGGRLFTMMKARTITDPNQASWVEFLARYREILSSFEQDIVPHLVEADI